MNWTEIINEKPLAFNPVLCYDDFYNRVYMAYRNEEDVWTICFTDKMLRSVVKWMPVPEK